MDSSIRKLAIGLKTKDFSRANFFDNTNLYEYDLILLPLSAVAQPLIDIGITDGKKVDSYTIFHQHKTRIDQKFSEYLKWVQSGNVLIILADSKLQFRYESGGSKETSGIFDPQIFSGVRVSVATGARVEYCGPKNLQSLLGSITSDLKYQFLIDGKAVKPLFRVSTGGRGTGQQLVGTYRQVGDGLIVYLPPFNATPDSIGRIEAFYEKITHTYDFLPLKSATTLLPGWIDDYVTSQEREKVGEREKLKAKVMELEGEISGFEKEIVTAREAKALFTSSGDQLVDCVIEQLKSLGLEAIKGPHPRADVIAFDGKTLFAIEVKGIDGGAREMHVRQCEKWVAELRVALVATPEDLESDKELSDYSICLSHLQVNKEKMAEIEVKGVVIVAAFRNTAILDRNEPDFPDTVVRSAKRGEICLLTGLQLYCLSLWHKGSEEQKQKIVELLSTTNGLLEIVEWKDFLIPAKQ